MQNGFERNYSYVYKPFATEFLDFFRIKTSSTALIFSSIEYFGLCHQLIPVLAPYRN